MVETGICSSLFPRAILIVGISLAVPATVWSAEHEVAFLANTGEFWQVWTMNADGSSQRQITQSPYDKNRLSWFRDGQEVLVCGNQGELVRLDVMTGVEVPVAAPLKGIQDAVLSPNGQLIAFSLSTSDSVDDNNLWIMNVDGSAPMKVTNMSGLQHYPTWMSNGDELYYLSGAGGEAHDIWRIRLDDRNTEQLTVGQVYHFDLAVSPRGEIAFSGNRSGNYEIWLWNFEGSARALTSHPALDGGPTFSPDGQHVIFESTRGGSSNLWRKATMGTDKPVQLTDYEIGARSAVWYHPASEHVD